MIPFQYPNVDAAQAALAATASQPTLEDPTDGPMLASYQRRAPKGSLTAKPQVGGHAPLIAPTVRDNYLRQQMEQQNQQQQPHVVTAANPYQPQGQAYNPYGGQAQPNANMNPAGASLGDQYRQVPRTAPLSQEEMEARAQNGFQPDMTERQYAGRNVELIRGGQSHVEHFGATGNNEGIVTPGAAHLSQMLSGVDPKHLPALQAYATQPGVTAKDLWQARTHLESQDSPSKAPDWRKTNEQLIDRRRNLQQAIGATQKRLDDPQLPDADRPMATQQIQNYYKELSGIDSQLAPPQAAAAVAAPQAAAAVAAPQAAGSKGPVPRDIAKQAYDQAGGDPAKAREALIAQGYTIP